MARTDEHLQRWREAGLIDEAAVARIEAFEAATAVRAKSERPGVIEALIYLGLAVIGVGAAVLSASNWEHLESWARIIVLAVPGVLGLAAGQVMRASEQPGYRRGGHMAWVVAAALLTAAAAVSAAEAGWEEESVNMAAGLTATTIAIALWMVAPSYPQIVGLAGGLFLFSIAVGANSIDHEMLFGAGILTLFGGAGLALVELNLLTPKLAGQVLAGIAFAGGAFYAGLDDTVPGWVQVVTFVAGGALIALSIRRSVLLYMAFGVGAVFLGLIATILRHVDDPTMASLLLMLIGVLLIAGVLLLARLRPWAPGEAAA
jgi:hypothetical protein